MTAGHLEILVEEPSMEAFLRAFLPRVIGPQPTFRIMTFQGKTDLLSKLSARLRAYADWIPADHRIIVVLDRDDDDCRVLKQRIEADCAAARLPSRAGGNETAWKVATRLAIEELEAWYFGDWQAVQLVYPRVNPSVPMSAAYRHPDDISGGTWEALERLLKKAGYFKGGLRKIEIARQLGAVIDPDRNSSPSFQSFVSLLREAAS